MKFFSTVFSNEIIFNWNNFSIKIIHFQLAEKSLIWRFFDWKYTFKMLKGLPSGPLILAYYKLTQFIDIYNIDTI
jgi:hypothetical protein